MEEIVTWIFDNKKWLFSGIGFGIIVWIGRLIFKKTCTSSTQTIHSGNNSTNFQAGRDVNIRSKKKQTDVE
ncbi:hypothetical protein [Nitrosomonas sp.]|uniref:hypothetical protein n=1 Tax=Nitrosomonas sp. TaxID=42353 RepID=UPI001D402B01|nr:hypothetical protein [Nitrosomonas sp.]MBX3615915.1 hypothetical protein [Nitrosomonas sp.]